MILYSLDYALLTHSVTRFGEISPLRQHFINLCHLFEDLIGVWQIFKPTLAKLFSL